MELAFPYLQMPEFEGAITDARRRLEGLM